jgi:hypothetical protein
MPEPVKRCLRIRSALISMNQRKKAYSPSQRALTITQARSHASVWTLNLVGYSKIAQQYYCELHRKRPQALLGKTDFNLPYEMTADGFLRVKREDFKKLAALVRERIIHDPAYVGQLVSSRQGKLEILRRNLDSENKLLESGCVEKCNPLQTFSYLTDFACFYIEYNFPFSLFKELIIEKLGYSEDAYENLRLRLLTPYESAYLTYYRAILKLALQKLSNTEVDLCSFRQKFSAIGDRELRSRSDRELEEAIQRIISMFGSRVSLRYEIMKISAVEHNIRAEHAKIKNELLLRCCNQAPQVSNLVSSLSDMLIDAALENEQTSIWRGRVFAYLNCLIEALGMNPRTVSVEEIQSKISAR